MNPQEALAFPAFHVVPKQWGEERWLENSDGYCAKLLIVAPGRRCSDHRHFKKSETFILLHGSCVIQVGDHQQLYLRGAKVPVPVGTWHWFGIEGPSDEFCVILEISTHHEDDDCERRRDSGAFN